jgi:hypothetical protein
MAKTATKSSNPAYPDAHPTAPGGMSEKALVLELTETHGWDAADAITLNWPGKIDAVIAERLNREREASGAMFEAAQPDTDDDLDALLEELTSATSSTGSDDGADTGSHSLLTKLPGVFDYIFNGHYGAGPSASERWMTCTASLAASRKFLETLTPNQQEQFAVASEAARQGTTAHAAAEVEARVVIGQMDQDEADTTLLELAIEPDTDGEAYDDEMAEYITEYVDLIRTYAQDRGNDHVLIEAHSEAAVPLTGMHEGEVYVISGRGDCVVLPTPEDPTLVVSDLKYGNGIDVEVDANPQVRIYGLGALALLVDDDGNLITDVETITYHIVQPRLGGIKTWSEPLADLLAWRDEVLAPALTAALYGQAEGAVFNPSESACQFCPARGGCPALTEQRVAQAAELFDVIVEAEFADGPGAFPETTALDDAALGSLLAQISGLIDLHKDLKAEAERRLFRGGQVPGFTLVNYSPPRKWKEGAAEALPIEDNPFLWGEPKLLTPTAAEKIVGKENYEALVAPLVDKPSKRPVVAPVGDRRKAWEGRPPEAMFDDESVSGNEEGS